MDSRKEYIYVYGDFTYSDCFDKNHPAEFRYEQLGPIESTSGGWMKQSLHGNDYDKERHPGTKVPAGVMLRARRIAH